MRRYFIILIIFILHHCTINEIQSGAEKNLISSYKGYSFDEYVKLLMEENKSKNYQNIDSINE